MNLFDHCCDPFLKNLSQDLKNNIMDRVRMWGLYKESFFERLDNWFCNFDTDDDKRLAYKLFMNLEYYDHDKFNRRLNQLFSSIKRHMKATNNDTSDILIVTPEGAGDSADRHAYDIIKQWGIPREQICSVDLLNNIEIQDPVFVLFNDTHGSGNQFLREIWPQIKEYGEHSIYILAIAISKEALKRFREEMPRVHVIPYIPVQNAWGIFTGEECERLKTIGERVYSSHPMGYGQAGLLTAYYYQCPNNSLPVIWADGKNNRVDRDVYPWSPLFPYIPKKKSATISSIKSNQETIGPTSEKTIVDRKLKSKFKYKYRVALIDIDLGLTDLADIANELNALQWFFHFTCPTIINISSAQESVVKIKGQANLSVYEIDSPFFEEYNDLAVDVVACFTKYPLAFATDEYTQYNYFSGPSRNDDRFMFISANQLNDYTKKAKCTLEEGLVYILISQLAVYFTSLGYHENILSCPMDFCEIRSEMIKGLKKRIFCDYCTKGIQNQELLSAFNCMLKWNQK